MFSFLWLEDVEAFVYLAIPVIAYAGRLAAGYGDIGALLFPLFPLGYPQKALQGRFSPE